MRMLAGLIGAIVAALLVVWLMNSSRSVIVDATYEMPMPATAPAGSPSKPAEIPPPVPKPVPEPASAPALPELPAYIQIVEPLAGATAKIESTLPARNAIELKTAGVRRLRLLRSEWPHRVTTSIAVRIDDQGIEWTSRRDVLELERRDNGDWVILSSAASAPARRSDSRP